MSKYTTELRFICESACGLDESVGYNDIDRVIAIARPSIFDFDYPIFDRAYREVLETKIINHYYTREICCETVGRWKQFLKTAMNEIMPKYNYLYAIKELEDFNPLYDTDVWEKHDEQGESHTTGKGTNQSDSKSYNLFQDTPQNDLSNLDSMKYVTNATKDTNDSSSASTSKADGNTTMDYLKHRWGKLNSNISYAQLMDIYARKYNDVDVLIINELEDLFFGLW